MNIYTYKHVILSHLFLQCACMTMVTINIAIISFVTKSITFVASYTSIIMTCILIVLFLVHNYSNLHMGSDFCDSPCRVHHQEYNF